jgi:hypothetical protein
MPEKFDRAALVAAFGDLGRRAWERGRTIEIAVYGGSALILTYDWRQATRDVDAVFEVDKTLVRQLAADIATDRGWSETWLNDGVKGFLSALDHTERRYFATFPSEDAPGLRVFVASPAYLFAMKCRAMRLAGAEEVSDVADIRSLARELGILTAAQALDLMAAYFPNHVLAPKTRFGLEELFPGPDLEPGM